MRPDWLHHRCQEVATSLRHSWPKTDAYRPPALMRIKDSILAES
jgi:hypothetical protein